MFCSVLRRFTYIFFISVPVHFRVRRQYLPNYRTYLKKRSNIKIFYLWWHCRKEYYLCLAGRFNKIPYRLSSTGDVQNFTSIPFSLSPQSGSNWLQRPFQLFLLYLCNSKEHGIFQLCQYNMRNPWKLGDQPISWAVVRIIREPASRIS